MEIQNILLISVFLTGCFFQSMEPAEQDRAKPLFEVIGPTKIIPSSDSGDDEYVQYDLAVTQIEDSIFYFSPSEDGKLYYPFGYEYIKLNEDKTTSRTSIVVDRTDTVKAVILPGEKGQFHFRIPRFEIASDTLVFRFVYFDNSNLHTGKVAEAILLQD